MATIPKPVISANGSVPSVSSLNSWMVSIWTFFKDRPQAQAIRNTNQSIPNLTETAVALQVEDKDTDSMWSSGSNMTVKTQGLYLIAGQVTFASSATGRRAVYLKKNNNRIAASTISTGASGIASVVNVAMIVPLAVNDVISMSVIQESGAALNITAANGGTRLTCLWLSESLAANQIYWRLGDTEQSILGTSTYLA